jgi:crotonobetainyl-CoA hydratase
MKHIRMDRQGAILEITLNRPPVNAINAAVSDDLYAAYCRLRDDPELRVGIITGSGDRIFSAGWDLKEVAAAVDPAAINDSVMTKPGGFGGVTEFWDLHKPVIAAVNGAAVGGGFEIALAADIIIAAEHAYFALPEMTRGFVPDAGAVQRLPRRVPYNVAVDLLLTGRRMDASEAARWGLVHSVVPKSDLLNAAREMAQKISEAAPLAVGALLEILPAIDPLPLRDAFDRMKRGRSGLPIYEQMMVSDDFLEGSRAYVEKRKPVWRGR